MLERVPQLLAAIARPQDLSLAQALDWYRAALDFRPDVIIELGRGYGNSTAVMAEAANEIGARVKSFDLAPGWMRYDAVAKLVAPDWFDALELHAGDLTRIDFAPHIGARTLIIWDAHGIQVADAVLGHILPLIADRPHLVICHDMTASNHPPYDGKPAWRGMDSYARGECAPVNLCGVSGTVDQLIPILDFCWRNGIALHPHSGWAHFSLNETSARPLHFPARAAPAPQPARPAARHARIAASIRALRARLARACRPPGTPSRHK